MGGSDKYLAHPWALCYLSGTHFGQLCWRVTFWLGVSLHVLEFLVLFLFFTNCLMSSMYIRWLIFSCDLLSLYPAVHFQNMWLSGIMAIMNCNSESESLWQTPLWIFASAKLLPPAIIIIIINLSLFVSFSLQFLLVVSPKSEWQQVSMFPGLFRVL